MFSFDRLKITVMDRKVCIPRLLLKLVPILSQTRSGNIFGSWTGEIIHAIEAFDLFHTVDALPVSALCASDNVQDIPPFGPGDGTPTATPERSTSPTSSYSSDLSALSSSLPSSREPSPTPASEKRKRKTRRSMRKKCAGKGSGETISEATRKPGTIRSHTSRARARAKDSKVHGATLYQPRASVGKKLLESYRPISADTTLSIEQSTSGYVGRVESGNESWVEETPTVDDLCGPGGLGFRYIAAGDLYAYLYFFKSIIIDLTTTFAKALNLRS
jgi:hypothetical protein